MRYVVEETGLNSFRLIKKVLDELYCRLPSKEKDILIQNRLENLRYEYKGLDVGAVPSYNDFFKNFAYVYCYVAAHANIVYELLNLKNSQELADAFDGNILKLSCLGGGPGSDIVGILKYVESKNKLATLNFCVYDREVRWRDSLSSVCNHLTSFSIFPTFRMLDVTDVGTWMKHSELLDSDLFTMSYFMSEVYSRHNDANTFFKYLFEQAKLGSFFFFVDNILIPTHKWFDDLVKEHNHSRKQGRIRLINTSDWCQSQQYSFQMESNEYKEDLSPYYGRYSDRFGRASCPKLKADVVFRVCRKE